MRGKWAWNLNSIIKEVAAASPCRLSAQTLHLLNARATAECTRVFWVQNYAERKERGACSYDVHTEGEGGLKSCQLLRTNSSNSTDRLLEMRAKGEKAVKILKFSGCLLYMTLKEEPWRRRKRAANLISMSSFSLWPTSHCRQPPPTRKIYVLGSKLPNGLAKIVATSGIAKDS